MHTASVSRRWSAIITIAGSLSLCAAVAHAQGSSQHSSSGPIDAAHAFHSIPVPAAEAARRTTPIVVDGKIDEAAWQQATPITDFKQNDPDVGQPASEKIDVRFMYDDDALYVAAKMYDHLGRAGVHTTVVRRDDNFNSDYFELVIDGYHDHLSRAFFDINPSGSKQDQLGIGARCCDPGWDPVYDVATHIDDDGWSLEMRIPFSQLRFSRDSVQTWGLQVRRYIQRRNETDQWSYWGKTEYGGPARFGHLEGLRIHDTPHHVELLPYAASKSSHVLTTPGDPFHSSSPTERVGLDLKYQMTPTLTLDATFNPDFGQVEVDPAVVNLSAYETFFQERRPFFVSGSSVFQFGAFNCHFCSNVSSMQAFYSRRIGRAPTGADLAQNAGPYADVPDATTILGAAKLTGRTRNGYTVGLLNAVTGEAMADVQRVDGTRTRQEVEPLANYFVGRLNRDYLGGNLVVGGIVSSIVRNVDSTFAPRLSKHAEFVGTDFRYAWNQQTYSVMGNAGVSSVEGDSRVIYAKQLASARYFQRPDRGSGSGGFFSTRLDSTATAMHGYGGYMRVAKDAGDWNWEVATNFRSPSFETNDYSFLTNADYIWNNANLVRQWTKPTRWYRQMVALIGGQTQQNYEGDMTQNTQAQAYFQETTPQFWNVSTFYIWYPSGMYDDRLLRGGPSVRIPGSGYYSLNVSTDSRKQWQLSVNHSISWNDAHGWGRSDNVSASVQPSSRVYASFGPSWYDGRSKWQYVQAVPDPTATTFSGNRYVLSDLLQHQLALDTRVNVTFTPTMTLQLYVQPFIATGHYFDFKEFDAPRSLAYSVYGRDRGTVSTTTDASGHTTGYTIDPDGSGTAAPFTVSNPDFNFRSLRGNAVFRWEYRPGSTVYFAWTQNRQDVAAIGDYRFGRDEHAIFNTRPDNIFLIKASWWLAR